LENLDGRQGARPSVQPCAGVRARPTQIQIVNRRPISCPADKRPGDKDLIEREIAMEDVSRRQTVSSLEIERRDDLARDDTPIDTWRVRGNRLCDEVTQAIAL